MPKHAKNLFVMNEAIREKCGRLMKVNFFVFPVKEMLCIFLEDYHSPELYFYFPSNVTRSFLREIQANYKYTNILGRPSNSHLDDKVGDLQIPKQFFPEIMGEDGVHFKRSAIDAHCNMLVAVIM